MKIININKLLEERQKHFADKTDEILKPISEKLSEAFRKIYNAEGREFKWTGIERLEGSTKSVMVQGNMPLQIGEVVTIKDENITIDESNKNSYNRFVKFSFPIIMLELGTSEELCEHMEKISKLGSFVNVTPEQLVKLIDKAADDYDTKVLNDPSKLAMFDAATKPSEVLGFSTDILSDEQIRKLKLIEKLDFGGVN